MNDNLPLNVILDSREDSLAAVTNHIKKLVERIIEAKYNYYVIGKSSISDQDYDKLEEELRSIDPNNSIFDMVGYPIGVSAEVGPSAHPAVMIKRDCVSVEQMIQIKQYYKIWPFHTNK